jgi:hypothetical protein
LRLVQLMSIRRRRRRAGSSRSQRQKRTFAQQHF